MADLGIAALYFFVATVRRDHFGAAAGSFMCFASLGVVGLLNIVLLPMVSEPWAWYAVMWLVSYGLYCGFSFLKLRRISIITSLMVLFETWMVIDSYMAPDVPTAAYMLYPYIMTTLHALIIVALMTEEDDANRTRHHPDRRSRGKGGDDRIHGGHR